MKMMNEETTRLDLMYLLSDDLWHCMGIDLFGVWSLD